MEKVKEKNLFRSDAMQKLLAFASLILLFVIFSFLSPNFLKFDNIAGILLATSVNGIIALGVTFVIITGGIDLAAGTVMSFAGVMTGVFVVQAGLPMAVGILLGILTGTLCGLISGFCVARLEIPAFIATMGVMMATKGLALIVSGSKPIYFTEIEGYSSIAMSKILGIPSAVLIFLLLALAAHFLLTKTILGSYNFAIGSNEDATRLSGINTAKWKIFIYMIGGTFCGIAGVVLSARLNSAQPAVGSGYEMDAIAAAVIGGTSLNGGEGSILGTVIGAFIISVLTNGLRIMSVPQEWQTVVTGLIVVGAVYLDIVRRRGK